MRRGVIIAGIVGLALGSGATALALKATGRLTTPAAEPELLVTLGQTLEAEHARVDVLLARGEVGAAIAALEGLRALAWPSRAAGGDAAVQLRHDAYGRLVRLRLDHPEVDPVGPAELLVRCDEGLGAEAGAIAGNAFTARLHALRGEVLAAMGRDEEALAAYERALEINRELLQRALGAKDGAR